MVQRAAFLHRHTNHGALGPLGRLADRLRHLARLAGAVADAALLVADHHQRCERKPPPALHHLGHAVDCDQLVDDVVAAVAVAFPLATPTLACFACHSFVSLERQPAFAGSFG
jgi:hypothetical protein